MFAEGLLKRSKHIETNFELQITALIDTLVIILIFLLKSISMETLEIEQTKNLSIPSLNQGISSGKGVRLTIASDGLSWNSQKIINMNQFTAKADSDWRILDQSIAQNVEQAKADNSFDGKLFLEADKNTPFPLVSKALRIAKQNGYKDIRFVGTKYN